MAPNALQIQRRLSVGELREMFMDELGWDSSSLNFRVVLLEPGQRLLDRLPSDTSIGKSSELPESQTFTLHGVAHKRGLTVLTCSPLSDGTIPNAPTRYRIQHKVAATTRENIVVYTDAGNARQVWQWVRRGTGVPIHLCEHSFALPAEGETLTSRLLRLSVDIDEEDAGAITLAEMVGRVSAAFYVRRRSRNHLPYQRSRISEYDLRACDSDMQAWLRSVYSIPRLGLRDEQNLVRAAQTGDAEAERQFVEANFYLVTEMAWKMTRDSPPMRNLLPDLIQEGYFALLRSVANFDIRHGYRFQSYARFCLRRLLSRELCRLSNTIALPVYVQDRLTDLAPLYELETDRLWHSLGREPSIAEIGSRLTLKKGEQQRLFLLSTQVQSLDAPEVAGCLRATSDEDRTHCPSATAERSALTEALMTLMNELRAREQIVIVRRFGLGGADPMTLEEVGQELQVTRERIRQIERAALLKLQKKVSRPDLIALLTGDPDTPIISLKKPPIALTGV